MKPARASESLRRIASAIDSSKSPDREAVARDLRRVLAAIEPAGFDPNEFFSPGESLEQHFSWLEPLDSMIEELKGDTRTPPAGSELLWHAMKEFGIKDWGPNVDSSAIIARAVEMAESTGNPGVVARTKDYATRNWGDFMKKIWPQLQAGKTLEDIYSASPAGMATRG